MNKRQLFLSAAAGLLALSAIPVLATSHKAVSGIMPAEMRSRESSMNDTIGNTTIGDSTMRLAKPAKPHAALGKGKSSKLSTRSKKLSTRRHHARTLVSKHHKGATLIKRGKSAATTAHHHKHKPAATTM